MLQALQHCFVNSQCGFGLTVSLMTISVCPNTVEKDNYIPSSVNILKGIASCLEDSGFPRCTERYFCEKPEIISYSKRKYI